jgi:hypothetical protein
MQFPPSRQIAVGSSLFFIPDGSLDLWMSDGTPEGTMQLPLLVTGIQKLANVNNKLILSSNDGSLWRTDGTLTGTQTLGVFDPSLSSSRWFVTGNPLFVTQTVSANLNSLITTDGTPTGTLRLLDYSPTNPVRYVAEYGDGFVLVMGNELWGTNGTPDGTHKLLQLLPAKNMSPNINNYKLAGNTLYFEANYGETGYELWGVTFSDQPNVQLSLPERVFVSPTRPAALAIDITNFGSRAAQSVTLTATLGLSLTYLSDTSGVTPTQQGNTLVWAWPNLGGLARKVFDLSVGLPNSTIGSSYPISFTLSTSTSASNEQVVEVVTSKLTYLPFVFR